ncbi:transglutaminase family protein [Aureimonas psammosilenae]|uniref:transglutaminase family protein n=1 Tax=Aureimonas psammosilenae TaxID=2495496 RepID=UPI001260B65F|nr:transglutaminase family protein [Aureimonas psammosilenae]
MTVFSVRHTTLYRYARPVAFGEHRLMFRPRDSYDQRLIETVLEVEPKPKSVQWLHDVFGNCVAVVRPGGKSRELRFETRIQVDHSPQAAPDFRADRKALTYPFAYGEDEAEDLARLIARHYPDPKDEVGQWARQFVAKGKRTNTGSLLMTLCYAIRESFSYSRRLEAGTQPPLQTLHTRRGTCRDFALFMMEAVRSLGFAARFVTGYIYVPDRDGSQVLGGGATHAWCEVFIPGAGWVEFDPTNGIVGSRDLIRVAVTRDPRQAIPLSGSYFGEASDDLGMVVQVNVTTQDVAPLLLPKQAERTFAEG